MSGTSDLTLNANLFGSSPISEETHAFNQQLMEIMANGPKWYEVGAKKYRLMRAAGETPLPKAVYLESAQDMDIPSRDPGRTIPCRIFKPENGKTATAVFLHIHGGGWVLQDQMSQDPVLQDMANFSGTIAFSVGYRLAPEDPFPAGPNDCYDVAEWLIDNAETTFGVPLAFIGGESAGGHLSMLVALHLLQSSTAKYADYKLKGLLLHFGCYSLIWTPNVYHFQKPEILVLDRSLMEAFRSAFLPGMTDEQMRDPSVSPLFTDLEKLRGRLPPALFTCGTEDSLLDDTMFMSTKWLMAGGEAVVKIFPGAPHGFIFFPRSIKGSCADAGMIEVERFMLAKLKQ